MTAYNYDEAVVWAGLGGYVRSAAGVRSTSILDPATGLPPVLTQGGVTVAYLTATGNGRVTFTATSDTVRADFGAGPVILLSLERIAAAAPSLTSIDGGTL